MYMEVYVYYEGCKGLNDIVKLPRQELTPLPTCVYAIIETEGGTINSVASVGVASWRSTAPG